MITAKNFQKTRTTEFCYSKELPNVLCNSVYEERENSKNRVNWISSESSKPKALSSVYVKKFKGFKEF